MRLLSIISNYLNISSYLDQSWLLGSISATPNDRFGSSIVLEEQGKSLVTQMEDLYLSFHYARWGYGADWLLSKAVI